MVARLAGDGEQIAVEGRLEHVRQGAHPFHLLIGEGVSRAPSSPATTRASYLYHDALTRADGPFELVVGALREHPTVVHDHHSVADLLDLLHVVARVHHRGPFAPQPFDALEDGVAALGVDRHGGFVEEDEIGPVGDSTGDVEPALQASRELVWPEAHEVFQPDELDGLVDERLPAGAVPDVERAEVVDVLADGELLEDGDLLGHDADAPLEVVALGPHRLAEQLDAAPVVGQQAEHAVDARGLPRPVGTQQAEDLAARHAQVEVV